MVSMMQREKQTSESQWWKGSSPGNLRCSSKAGVPQPICFKHCRAMVCFLASIVGEPVGYSLLRLGKEECP